MIAANHDDLFRRLCTAMARHDLAEDPRFATHDGRGANQEVLEAEIQTWAAQHSAAEIDAALADSGVVCAPVSTIADVLDDPHVQARDMLPVHEAPELGSFRAPGVFPHFSRGSGGVRWTGKWEPGADNLEVLGRP